MSRWKLANPTSGALVMREWTTTPNGQEYKKRQAEYAKEWRRNNRAKFHESQRRCYEKARREMLVRYSSERPSCACCGEDQLVFLSLDHIAGNGSEHRRQIQRENNGTAIGGNSLPYWLKKHGWPDGFQVLCYNCNFAKRTGVVCPHQTGNTFIRQRPVCLAVERPRSIAELELLALGEPIDEN